MYGYSSISVDFSWTCEQEKVAYCWMTIHNERPATTNKEIAFL